MRFDPRHFTADDPAGGSSEEPPPAVGPDPIAALQAQNAALEQRLATQERETREAMQAMVTAIQQLGTEPAGPSPDEQTLLRDGYYAVAQSRDPRDVYVRNLAGQVNAVQRDLQVTKAENAQLKAALEAGVPASDMAACRKYLESGDAGNLKAAHRLVLMDKLEEERASGGTSPPATGGGSAPSGGAPALGSAPPPMRPNPGAPPAAPAPRPGGAPGTMKQSEWANAVEETDARGRPTTKALELLAAERSGSIRFVPG